MNADVTPMNADERRWVMNELRFIEFRDVGELSPLHLSRIRSAFIGVTSAFIGVSKAFRLS
jgi:hypothetical protein